MVFIGARNAQGIQRHEAPRGGPAQGLHPDLDCHHHRRLVVGDRSRGGDLPNVAQHRGICDWAVLSRRLKADRRNLATTSLASLEPEVACPRPSNSTCSVPGR